jgi:hypothetical protein
MTPEEAMAAMAAMADGDFEATEEGPPEATVAALVEAAHRVVGRPSLTAPGRQSPQITLRLSESADSRLAAAAQRLERRRSDIVREAIDRWLDDVA